MRTFLALIRSLALALIFVAFVCAFATTSDDAINLGELAQSKSTQFAHPTDDALAPLQPLIASVTTELIEEAVPPMVKWLMKSPMVKWLMESVVFFVLVHFLIHVPWTTTLLGVFLVLVALFFPSSVLPEASKARVKLPGGIGVSFQGGLRLAAIIPGIILIASGAFEGGKGCSKDWKDYRSVYHHETV